jgi:hypothetical protein
MLRRFVDEATQLSFTNNTPMRRLGDADKVAQSWPFWHAIQLRGCLPCAKDEAPAITDVLAHASHSSIAWYATVQKSVITRGSTGDSIIR